MSQKLKTYIMTGGSCFQDYIDRLTKVLILVILCHKGYCMKLASVVSYYFLKIYRSSRSQMFLKIVVLENFAIFTGKHLCWSLFLIKLTPTQLFSCEYWKIFKNTFFYRTPPVDAWIYLY